MIPAGFGTIYDRYKVIEVILKEIEIKISYLFTRKKEDKGVSSHYDYIRRLLIT